MGPVVEGYEISKRLGQGGLGEVWEALNVVTGQRVALKQIHPVLFGDEEARERFLREAQLGAGLKHPNIVQVLHVGHRRDGTIYIVMELLEGDDLKRLVEKQGRLPVSQACDYIRQAARGLAHAHKQGLVHRDVKPANLMVTPEGVKLLDCGVALAPSPKPLTRSGQFVGTAEYIAPEQYVNSHEAGHPADVYSLGVTLYELLAGRLPYQDAHPAIRAQVRVHGEPPAIESLRQGLSQKLADVVRKMMAAKPEDRYQTAGEVDNALAPFAPPDQAPQGGDIVTGWLLMKERLEGEADGPVFRASDGKREAEVCVISGGQTSDPAWVERFAGGLKALKELRPPALHEVLDFGRDENMGCFYAVFEPRGQVSLRQHLDKKGPLGLEDACRLFMVPAEGLAAAHGRGLIHGRIHSGNISLSEDGRAKLGGVALAGAAGGPGTLGPDVRAFAAPELLRTDRTITSRFEATRPHRSREVISRPVLRGGQANASADVYALAACVNHALFYGDPTRYCPDHFDADAVPEALRGILARALASDPARRPTAAAFANSLRGGPTGLRSS